MTPAAGRTFGIVGALAAFPRRLAAREVERQHGHLRSSISRRTTDVVFGRKLLLRSRDDAVAARAEEERQAGRRPLSENGFLRLLGLRPRPPQPGLTRAALIEQSGLAGRDLDLLALFDAFESDAEPYSFRDLILSKKYAGLIAGGADWGAIVRSIHRSLGAVTSLTALSLEVDSGEAIYARLGDGLSELDGQMLLPIERADDAELDELFSQAEEAEADGLFDDAAALYQRCLAVDPRDPDAAFNRANCLAAAGRAEEARRSFLLALKLDPEFVEAWFNLANLLKSLGQAESARQQLLRAIALDGDYADAVYNLAALEFEAGHLPDARRWWKRYLELDSSSDWARNAARGLQYIDMQLARRNAG